jgi:hypothetical protein
VGTVTNITDATWESVVNDGSKKQVVLVDFTAK